jgi:hypothetical protein
MTEAELIALAAIVQRETAEMVAANLERESNGHAHAYSDFESDASRVLRRELERRKIF